MLIAAHWGLFPCRLSVPGKQCPTCALPTREQKQSKHDHEWKRHWKEAHLKHVTSQRPVNCHIHQPRRRPHVSQPAPALLYHPLERRDSAGFTLPLTPPSALTEARPFPKPLSVRKCPLHVCGSEQLYGERHGRVNWRRSCRFKEVASDGLVRACGKRGAVLVTRAAEPPSSCAVSPLRDA